MPFWQLSNVFAALLIPPGIFLIGLAAGLLSLRNRPQTGRAVLLTTMIGLYTLSMPLTGTLLLQQWETPSGEIDKAPKAQAIVVLGSGKYPKAPEYGGDTVNSTGLARLRYAASLHRQSGLPILVSGGSPDGGKIDEAQIMIQVLEREFSVPVIWSEGKSANTLENARLSGQILLKAGIKRIYLVTHAWHMPRARLAFEHAGFEVVAAPTAFATQGPLSLAHVIPDAGALLNSALFFREVIGTVWYRLRLFAQA
jgi:uncharacterized SAM-binding protein YcdF (DUF218 family)